MKWDEKTILLAIIMFIVIALLFKNTIKYNILDDPSLEYFEGYNALGFNLTAQSNIPYEGDSTDHYTYTNSLIGFKTNLITEKIAMDHVYSNAINTVIYTTNLNFDPEYASSLKIDFSTESATSSCLQEGNPHIVSGAPGNSAIYLLGYNGQEIKIYEPRQLGFGENGAEDKFEQNGRIELIPSGDVVTLDVIGTKTTLYNLSGSYELLIRSNTGQWECSGLVSESQSLTITNLQVTQSETIYYRLANNTCSQISILPLKHLAYDYATLQECNSHLTLNVPYYRLVNNNQSCTLIEIPESQKISLDFNNVSECLSHIDFTTLRCNNNLDCPQAKISLNLSCNKDYPEEYIENYKCVNNRCVNQTTAKVGLMCEFGCQNGLCKSNSSKDNDTLECNSLYYTDEDNSVCSYKEFCGAYLYSGLKTYPTLSDCQSGNKGFISKYGVWILLIIVIGLGYLTYRRFK